MCIQLIPNLNYLYDFACRLDFRICIRSNKSFMMKERERDIFQIGKFAILKQVNSFDQNKYAIYFWEDGEVK